jgi:hypothetical protein
VCGIDVERHSLRPGEDEALAGRAEMIRGVRTARSECLDWLLIVNGPHLERALTVFIDHFNGWRPHRSLDLTPPSGCTAPQSGRERSRSR